MVSAPAFATAATAVASTVRGTSASIHRSATAGGCVGRRLRLLPLPHSSAMAAYSKGRSE